MNYTVTQAAWILKLTRQGVHYRIRKGLLKAKKVGSVWMVVIKEKMRI